MVLENFSLQNPLLKEFAKHWQPKRVMAVVLALVGCLVSTYGIYRLQSADETEIVSSSDIQAQVCEQTADFGQITVYISGAVEHPGVYELELGARVVDAIELAGGIGKNADAVFINQQLNLAERLSDSDQIYIPTVADTISSLEKTTEVSSSGGGPISINSSTSQQLQELSGIGSVRAEKIIENRPYASVDELVEKEVISQSLLDSIRAEIVL